MVSILIPIFNTPIEYIQECFISIEKQTYTDYEIIVVNDGSNSITSSFLSEYRPTTNTKYKVISQNKQGISAALNLGISMCSYDIIARMDADDIMLPNRIEKQLSYLRSNNCNIVGGQMLVFGLSNYTTNHPTVIPKNIMKYTDWFVNHPTVMYYKQDIINIGGYNSEYDGCEDLELWCRSLMHSMQIKNMSDILLKHRRHNNNATHNANNIDMKDKVFRVRQFYYNQILDNTTGTL